MRPQFNRWNRQPLGQRPDREASDIKRGDKLLALVDARLESHGADGIVAWLRASPLASADQTTRALTLAKLRRSNLLTRELMGDCQDELL